jgi:putative SOS response-associated peptidase YedK
MLEIEKYYDIHQLAELDIWKREYNIPPRETASVVLESDGKRRLTAGLRSLMKPWADSLEHANRASTFNAKAETLIEWPAYRNAFLKRRCVVPAEAFYESVGSNKEREASAITELCEAGLSHMTIMQIAGHVSRGFGQGPGLVQGSLGKGGRAKSWHTPGTFAYKLNDRL